MTNKYATQRLRSDQLALLQRQHGAISRRQLIDTGATEADIRALMRRGDLVPTRPSVYVHPLIPSTFLQTATTAFLSIGDPMTFRSVTAAALWELQLPRSIDLDLRGLDVAVPWARRPRQLDLDIRRYQEFPDDLVTTHKGLPVTTVAFTVAELCGELGLDWAERAIDQALRNKLTSVTNIRTCAEFLEPVSRSQSNALFQLLKTRDAETSRAESELESKVLRWLTRAKLPKPALQHEVTIAGKRRRIDICYPDFALAIEVDGFKFHNDRGVFDRDRKLGNYLSAAGWLVIRVTSTTSFDEFVALVTSAIKHQRGDGTLEAKYDRVRPAGEMQWDN